MSSVRYLREFISARLTAAAEEIFGVFERTIEEELQRQRRLLENSWRTHLHRTELPLDCSGPEEKIPVQQQLCDQEESFCVGQEEPEPPQIKEEHENLWISQEEEQPALKQDTVTRVVTPTLEESDLSEPEPKGDWVLSESFPVTEREGSWHEKSSRCAELNSKRQSRTRSLCNTVRTQRPYNSALRSVKCDVCGKAFRYHSNMKVHYRVHTGEKPFSCKICEKAFSHKVNLFVHMRTHTGEKPFLCKICGKGFSHRSSLKKHVGSHRSMCCGSMAKGWPWLCRLCRNGLCSDPGCCSKMSSVQHLREFISARLTAAAEEIFGVFERTIVRYEEEINRQRRQLDISRKPPRNVQKSDLLRQYLSKTEETPPDHQPFNQQENPSPDLEEPEPPQVKEEHGELEIFQIKEEHEEDHQDNDAFTVTPTYEQRVLGEPEPNRDQLLSQIFSEAENRDRAGRWHEDSSSRELKPKEKHFRNKTHTSPFRPQSPAKTRSPASVKRDVQEHAFNTHTEMKTHYRIYTDLQQHYVSTSEDVPADQQLGDNQGSSSLERVEPEPPQIKEEQEEQFILTAEIDTLTVTSAYEDSDESESEPNTNQLLLHSFPEARSWDQRGNWHRDFRSTSTAEPVPEATQHQNTSYSSAVASQNSVEAGDGPVGCQFCGKVCENKMEMKEHYKLHTGEKSLSCSVCGKVFKYNVNLLVHMRTHTGEKPYSCETCGKCFSQKVNLNVHMRTHTGEKPYLCKTCGKRFSDSSGFKRHSTIHTGEKPYACKTCNKTFRYNVNLLVHMRTHTDERPYVCKTCGRTFSDPSTLRKHVITHTGAKSYSCQVCGKCFTDNSNLLRHIRTHTGEKPYSCEICGKRFSQSSNLMQHIRTHTGEKPYPCEICDKTYSHSCTLLKHMRSHTGEKPYSCQTCGRCFSHKCTLLKHMKVHVDNNAHS